MNTSPPVSEQPGGKGVPPCRIRLALSVLAGAAGFVLTVIWNAIGLAAFIAATMVGTILTIGYLLETITGRMM